MKYSTSWLRHTTQLSARLFNSHKHGTDHLCATALQSISDLEEHYRQGTVFWGIRINSEIIDPRFKSENVSTWKLQKTLKLILALKIVILYAQTTIVVLFSQCFRVLFP